MIKLCDSLRVLQEKIPNWRQRLLVTNIPKEAIKEIIYNVQQQSNVTDIVTCTAAVCHQLKTYLQLKRNPPNSQEKETPLELALDTIHSLSQQIATQLLHNGCSELIMDLHLRLERIEGLVKAELDTTLLEFELRFHHGVCTQIGKSLPPSTAITDHTSIT